MATTTIALSETHSSLLNGIRRPLEVVRGVDRADDSLLGAVKDLLAGAQAHDVFGDSVLVGEVLREAKTVAKRAINDASGSSVGRL
jgi:hypothetical protein